MTGWFKKFFKNDAASVALIFAFSLPMLLAATGVSVDLAKAYNAQAHLANALDKAALAAGSTSGTESQINDRVQKFFNANYNAENLGTPMNIHVTLGQNTVTVSADSRVPMSFMGYFGTDYMDVHATTTVRRETAGVEAVLVLDVTGSMAGNNITALKTAATSFINIMFQRINDLNYLKIGIVPFSPSVNVGPYGLGKDLNGNTYGTAFVTKPSTDSYVSPASNIVYSSTNATQWRGCVTEYPSRQSGSKDITDDATPNWGMYRYPKICSRTRNGVCQSYSNNDPNTDCTTSIVVPLTNNKTTLTNSINNLSPDGGTYTNTGLVWGWRVISPTAPFTEGKPYNDPDWTKTVVLMTDGNNEPNDTYSTYGASPGLTATDLNNKMTAVCTAMKAKGIRIYTVTFQSGITQATRDIFKACATDPAKYFNAPTNESLNAAFTQIADELSQLHITN